MGKNHGQIRQFQKNLLPLLPCMHQMPKHFVAVVKLTQVFFDVVNYSASAKRIAKLVNKPPAAPAYSNSSFLSKLNILG